MAGAKEIRGKIASIKNTQKITKAMEMVAASKMRKAQDRMRAARPYAEKIRKIIGHLRQVNLDFKHPFTLERPVKSVGIVVISTDRGLAGLVVNELELVDELAGVVGGALHSHHARRHFAGDILDRTLKYLGFDVAH